MLFSYIYMFVFVCVFWKLVIILYCLWTCKDFKSWLVWDQWL